MGLEVRRVSRAAVLCVALLFSLPLFAGKKTWTNTVRGGGWGTDLNWSPSGVPTENDDVYIGDSGTCTLPSGYSYEVRSLHVQKGGSLEVGHSTLFWQSSTPSSIDKGGVVVLHYGAALGPSGGPNNKSSFSIAGRLDIKHATIQGGLYSDVTIQKSGVVNIWATDDNGSGNTGFLGVSLTNRGTINFRDDARLAFEYTNYPYFTISNFGIIRKSGNGTGDIRVTVQNEPGGQIDAGAGTLNLSHSMTSAGTYRGNIVVGGYLGSDCTLLPGATVSEGRLTISTESTLTVSRGPKGEIPDIKIPELVLDGTLRNDGRVTATIIRFGLHPSGSTTTIVGPGRLTVTDWFYWYGGSISGDVVMGKGSSMMMYCTAGGCRFANSRLTIQSTAMANVVAPVELYNTEVFVERGGYVRLLDGAELKNDSMGVSRISVLGTLENIGGVKTSSVPVYLVNGKLKSSNAGTIRLRGGGATSSVSGSAPSISGRVEITGGVFELQTATSFSGAVVVNGGTLAIAPALTQTIDSFELRSGFVDGAGTLKIGVEGKWSGGTMSGSGRTDLTTDLTISGANSPAISTRTVRIVKPAIVRLDGNLAMSGGMLTIGSEFVLPDKSAINGTGLVMNNIDGLITKNDGGTSTIAAPLENNGLVENNGGTLLLSGSRGTHKGVFSASPNATIAFSAGNHTLLKGSLLGGPGTIEVRGSAEVTTSGHYDPSKLKISGGKLVTQSAGSAEVLTMSGGTLDGSGTISVTGKSSAWTGGTMTGSGVTLLSGTGTMAITATSSNPTLRRSFVNKGILAYSASGASRSFDIPAGSLTNQGTMNLLNDAAITGVGRIDNSGTFAKTGGALESSVQPPLHNSSIVRSDAGTLSLQGGGTHIGGTFNAIGTIAFAGGAHTLDPASSLTGTGLITVDGGTVTTSGPYDPARSRVSAGTLTLDSNGSMTRFGLSGGTLAGSGTLTINGDSFWSGGAMEGSGTTIVAPAGTLAFTGTGVKTLARALQNNGTFDIQTAQALDAAGTLPSFVNNGTLKRDSGSGVMQFNPPLTNMALVRIAAGTVHFTGAYVQISGTTDVAGGTLQTTTLLVDGGTLVGTGKISGNVDNGGSVAPGPSTGTLIVNGNYTQRGSGALSLELGGTASSAFDRLIVGGIATFDGNLDVSTINGFTPRPGNAFSVLTFGSRPGATDFANTMLPSASYTRPFSAGGMLLIADSIQSDLSASVSAPSAPVRSGDAFTYNVTIANGGGSNATGMSFTAALPSNVTFSGASPAICSGPPNLTCTVGSLSDLASASVAINVVATEGGPAPLLVSATAAEPDPNPANNAANATVTVIPVADTGVTISGAPSLIAGTFASYTIVVTNHGPATASNVSVVVTPSPQLTFTSNAGACPTGFPCTFASIRPGQILTIQTTWAVASSATGTAKLTAKVPPSAIDPNAGNESASALAAITRSADIAVTKSGPANVDPTSTNTITYDITLANDGPSDSGSVTLTDPVPVHLTLSSVTGDCATLPCAIASITSGQTKSVQATYTFDGSAAGTAITSTARVTSGEDGNAANDASSVTTNVAGCPPVTMVHPSPVVDGLSTNNPASVPATAGATYAWSITNGTITSGQGTHAIRFTAGSTASLGLSVTVTRGACVGSDSVTIPITGAEVTITKSGPPSVSPATSSTLTYSIAVANDGAIPATDVEIHDPTPSGLTFVFATGACTAFPCTIGELPAGASVNVQATYSFSSAAAPQTITNVATVIAPNDVDPSNNTAMSTTTIQACPTVTISAPVKVRTLQSSSASATDIPGATYSWSIANGTIDSGVNTRQVAFTAGSFGPMTLTVTVVAGQCEITTSETVDVTSADLTIHLTAPAQVERLKRFDYTIVVTNNGPGAADSFVVTDDLPDVMTFHSVSPAASCAGTSIVTCTFGRLAAGGTQTVVITVTAPFTTTTLGRNNRPTVSSPDDPITSNNDHRVPTYVQPCLSAVPILLEPAMNATVRSPITYTWTAVSGVDYYHVTARVADGDPDSSILMGDVEAGTTSVTASLPPGTYEWTVHTRFLPGNCAESTTAILRNRFTVLP